MTQPAGATGGVQVLELPDGPPVGRAGNPIVMLAASSVVWSAAMAPSAEMTVPTLTAEAVEAAPDLVYVVDPLVVIVLQKPSWSLMVIVEPLTEFTVPKR